MLSQRPKAEQTALPSMNEEIRIAELGPRDSEAHTDHLRVLKNLIVMNEDKYPGIERWFASKLETGLRSGERIAYIAYHDNHPIAAAVLKLGDNAKFCHLRINDSYHNLDLGQLFFVQMTLALRHHAKTVHFTLPESLWSQKSNFFQSFGFSAVIKASKQYRKGDPELLCSAPFPVVLSAALRKLPRLMKSFCLGRWGTKSDIVMSIRPQYAKRILTGAKWIEIRKRFSHKWLGHDISIYASQPEGAIVGKATVGSIATSSPADIWSRFEPGIGCLKSEFDAYVQSAKEVTAIELTDVISYQEPLSLNEVPALGFRKPVPPQSYCEVNSQKTGLWMNAVYLADLLQDHFMKVEATKQSRML